MLVEELNI